MKRLTPLAIALGATILSAPTHGLTAQTHQALADGALCSRAVDEKLNEAIDEVRQRAAHSDFFRGCAALVAGEDDAAVTAFERNADAAPRDPVAYLWLGRAYGEQAQHAFVLRQPGVARRARASFERAVEIAPDYLPAHDALMQFALQAPGLLGGGIDRARAEAAEIGKRDRHQGLVAQVTISRHEKDHAESVRLLQLITSSPTDSVKYDVALVAELGAMGEWDRAWAAVDAFERREPDAIRIQFAIGFLAVQSGRQLERGEAALQRYLGAPRAAGSPSYAFAHLRIAQLLEARKLPAEAKVEYQRALDIEPNLPAARAALDRLK